MEFCFFLLQAGPLCAGPSMGHHESANTGSTEEEEKGRRQAAVTDVSISGALRNLLIRCPVSVRRLDQRSDF